MILGLQVVIFLIYPILNKDVEIKGKDKGYHKGGTFGQSTLFSKNEDINDLWNEALNSQKTTPAPSHSSTTFAGSNTFGYAPTYTQNNTQMFGSNPASANVFGQSSMPYGGTFGGVSQPTFPSSR